MRSVVSEKNVINEVMGSVLDLSSDGCLVEAPTEVYLSLSLEVRIYVPDFDRPITVDRAVVQWVKGNRFGLRFVDLRQVERERLGFVIAGLAEESP